MESLVSLCYHAATNGQYVPGNMDWTGGGEHPSSQPLFALGWWHLQSLGLRPELERDGLSPYATIVAEQVALAAKAAPPPGPAYKAAPKSLTPQPRVVWGWSASAGANGPEAVGPPAPPPKAVR